MAKARVPLHKQVQAQAPEEARAYRLKIPSGDEGGRPRVVPREGAWTIEPFQAPTLVGEGRYELVWVGEGGQELPAPRGVPPALDVWWAPPEEKPELSPEETHRVGQLRQDLDRKEEELLQLKARVQHLTSESNELARMRALVSDSAEREMMTAKKATEQGQALLEAGGEMLSLIKERVEDLRKPGPATTPPLESLQPVMTKAIDRAGDVLVALIQRDPERAKKAMEQAGPLPAALAGAKSDPAPSESSPPAPPVVEVPVPPPEGAAAFADLAKELTEEERQELDAAMRDPARRKEFLAQIRKKPEGA